MNVVKSEYKTLIHFTYEEMFEKKVFNMYGFEKCIY